MRYEVPELTALTPAINAIQTAKNKGPIDVPPTEDSAVVAAYEDWE